MTRPGGTPTSPHPLPNWFNGYPPIDARILMGPMASIRIENFRDGMEDYNLLGVLSTAIDDHPTAEPAVLPKARTLLSSGDVVTDQRDFTEDPQIYRGWRADVAQAIITLDR